MKCDCQCDMKIVLCVNIEHIIRRYAENVMNDELSIQSGGGMLIMTNDTF